MALDKLQMSFDPLTIEHLGIKMYSVLPNAIAELIANAYDADASEVHINLQDELNNKSISISDDGLGMTFQEINDDFLRIGRRRRETSAEISEKGRKITGRKGLGKLAFFGIGNTIKIITKKNDEGTEFTLSWNEIKNCRTTDYEPKFEKRVCAKGEHGTIIVLSELKRQSDFDKEGLANSLSKLFDFFSDTFKVYISLNNDTPFLIDNKLKFQNLNSQIEWIIPDNADTNKEYFISHGIEGKIIATEKPLKPGLRGITLFAHGRLVNSPEFFGVGESSHAYSYLTGWINVDFVDEFEEDVISTDRQSLSWDVPAIEDLQNRLKFLLHEIERDWRSKRKQKKQDSVEKGINLNINSWYGKLPSDVQPKVQSIVDTVIDTSTMESDEQNKIIDALHILLPEYTYYHYRHLHPIVQEVSKTGYINKDYYHAFDEAMKRYVRDVQKKSDLSETDCNLMNKAFGKDEERKLKVAYKYKRTDGTSFNKDTIENIEEGQRWLSSGVMTGARNPIAHEEVQQLRDSGLFTEEDTLDLLSLLSHLFRRLENAQKVN
jgi:uncharacterized protein (TIGR02391 family)